MLLDDGCPTIIETYDKKLSMTFFLCHEFCDALTIMKMSLTYDYCLFLFFPSMTNVCQKKKIDILLK